MAHFVRTGTAAGELWDVRREGVLHLLKIYQERGLVTAFSGPGYVRTECQWRIRVVLPEQVNLPQIGRYHILQEEYCFSIYEVEAGSKEEALLLHLSNKSTKIHQGELWKDVDNIPNIENDVTFAEDNKQS